MSANAMEVSGSLGTISRGKSAKERSDEMQDVRECLIAYLSKSGRSHRAHIECVQVGELHPCDQLDMATQNTEHINQSAISKVVDANVITAKNIISMIDQGWDGACKCGDFIPTKRISCVLSTLCIECASKK